MKKFLASLIIRKYKPNSCHNASHSELLVSKHQKFINLGKDLESSETLHTGGRNVNLYSQYGNSMVIPPTKIEPPHQAWWYIPTIPAMEEAWVGGSHSKESPGKNVKD
jgi:hypothetical protein